MAIIKDICISPFQNESEVITINNSLIIENRLDRIQIYGEIDITKDKKGLENILALLRQVSTIAEYMKKSDLPDEIRVDNESKEVKNPFND